MKFRCCSPAITQVDAVFYCVYCVCFVFHVSFFCRMLRLQMNFQLALAPYRLTVRQIYLSSLCRVASRNIPTKYYSLNGRRRKRRTFEEKYARSSCWGLQIFIYSTNNVN